MSITGKTKVIGILGDPVAHSLSPAMHNAAFEALGLDFVYVPLPVRAADVGAAVRGLGALGFAGANVTVPHKTAVLPALGWLHADAALAQAVNTIVVEGDRLLGYNTDIQGAREALLDVCPDEEALAEQAALVLGAGGAARAVALALARLGMALTVVSRREDPGRQLVDLLRAAEPDAACRWLALSDLSAEVVAAHRVVVNATTLGMIGTGKVPAPLVDTVSAGQIAFDVVYSATETDFLAAARDRGATTVGGLGMLVGQAAAAFQLWTGEAAPRAVMLSAIGCSRQEEAQHEDLAGRDRRRREHDSV